MEPPKTAPGESLRDDLKHIDIVVVVKDERLATLLSKNLQLCREVDSVHTVEDPAAAFKLIRKGQASGVMIDLYADDDVQKSVDMIGKTRKLHPTVPFCLIGTADDLARWPDIPGEWRDRFVHYYQLFKDQPPESLAAAVRVRATHLHSYWVNASARKALGDASESLERADVDEGPEARIQLNTVLEEAQKALDHERRLRLAEAGPSPTEFIPGAQFQELITDTLEQISSSISSAARTNRAVLWVGLAMLVVAFTWSLFDPAWQPVAFGALGLGGLVSALVSTPLRALGKESMRLVQVQAAYVCFINQMCMLSECQSDDIDCVKLKCAQLNETLTAIKSSLEEAPIPAPT